MSNRVCGARSREKHTAQRIAVAEETPFQITPPFALNSQLIRSTPSHQHITMYVVVYRCTCDVNAIMRPMFERSCVSIRIIRGKSESLEMEISRNPITRQPPTHHHLLLITWLIHHPPTRLTRQIPNVTLCPALRWQINKATYHDYRNIRSNLQTKTNAAVIHYQSNFVNYCVSSHSFTAPNTPNSINIPSSCQQRGK